MKKLGKTEKSNNYRIRFNFSFLFFGGGGSVRLPSQNTAFLACLVRATLLSKYGNASLHKKQKRKGSLTFKKSYFGAHKIIYTGNKLKGTEYKMGAKIEKSAIFSIL